MNLADILVILVIAAILGAVILYICKARKKGIKCIGCPESKTCSGNCQGGCHGCPHAKKQ